MVQEAVTCFNATGYNLCITINISQTTSQTQPQHGSSQVVRNLDLHFVPTADWSVCLTDVTHLTLPPLVSRASQCWLRLLSCFVLTAAMPMLQLASLRYSSECLQFDFLDMERLITTPAASSSCVATNHSTPGGHGWCLPLRALRRPGLDRHFVHSVKCQPRAVQFSKHIYESAPYQENFGTRCS